jgi:hypothetical protein
MNTSKQAQALALRRKGTEAQPGAWDWSIVARYFGTSQRHVKRWAKQALLAEQEAAKRATEGR